MATPFGSAKSRFVPGVRSLRWRPSVVLSGYLKLPGAPARDRPAGHRAPGPPSGRQRHHLALFQAARPRGETPGTRAADAVAAAAAASGGGGRKGAIAPLRAPLGSDQQRLCRRGSDQQRGAARMVLRGSRRQMSAMAHCRYGRRPVVAKRHPCASTRSVVARRHPCASTLDTAAHGCQCAVRQRAGLESQGQMVKWAERVA